MNNINKGFICKGGYFMKKQNYDNMINNISKMLNLDKSKLENMNNNNNIPDIIKNMNDNDAQKIQNILSNPKETQKILKSQQAKEIIKKLMKK